MSETLRIRPGHPSQGAWVVIEAADFDPRRHTLYEEPVEAVGRKSEAPSAAEPAPALKRKPAATE